MAHIGQLPIGALKEADRNLQQMMSLAQETEDEFRQMRGSEEMGRILSYRGVWQKADDELKISTKHWEKTNDVQGICMDEAYRAQRFLLMARETPQFKMINLKSSIQSAFRALELADEGAKTNSPVPRDYIRAYWLLGAAYRANGDLTKAEENLFKAISMCRQINMVDHEADILLDLARLRYDQNNYEEAKTLAEEALTITERCGYVLQGADVNLFLAELALTLDPSPEGRGKAKEYAETALNLAYCDGTPYYYKVAYEEAERMLENLK